jgi:taste receptor type 2
MFLGVSLASFLFLVLSLWSHTRQMKLQGIYSKDSRTEAHIRAMKTMISFLVLFIIHCFSKIMAFMAYSILSSAVAKNITNVLFVYPSGHPFFLILWNSKLKQASLCVLRKLKCV